MSKLKYTIVFLLGLLAPPLGAKEVPPPSDFLVTDYVGILNRQERSALERKLVAYDDSTSTQIALVIDGSLKGEDIFEYSFRLAEAWNIGRKGKDNGVLIYIAFRDRQIFIQTGYGAEGFLPDAMAKRIVETILKPNFRREAYYRGLDRATDVIMQLGSGEYVNEDGDEKLGGIPTIIILIILIILVTLFLNYINRNNDDGGYYRGGRYDDDDHWGRKRRGGGWIFLPGGGGFGGGHGGSGGSLGGGGGFGGFGGGGFGGGGAGGSW